MASKPPFTIKKPDDRKQRLKLLMSGPAGVGKTTAALKMPKPMLFDAENGSVHYGDLIKASGGDYTDDVQTYDTLVAALRWLMTSEHDFKTVIVDPITMIYSNLMDEEERRFNGSIAMWGAINRKWKRLSALVTAIDMNVIYIAHEKKEYESKKDSDGKLEVSDVGKTFDGFKKMDYAFDLWLQLNRNRNTRERSAFVAKTRLNDAFPDGDEFPWGYDEIAKRFGRDKLEKGVETINLATADQIQQFKFLMTTLTEDEVKSLKLHKMDMDGLVDLPAERLAKGIELIENHKAAKIAE